VIASFTPATSVPSLDRPTVVRTRGEVMIHPSSSAADISVIGAYGLCVVTSDALAAGAASIPGPFDDADWEGWFVWRSFGIRFESITQAGVLLNAVHHEVDSKAMRKVGTNEAVVLMAESQVGAFTISMPLRLLIKLS